MPPWGALGMARLWGRTTLWLLRVLCRIDVAWEGLDKIPAGGVIIAAKHQSIWETFALVTVLANPAFIIKRELMWIPFFGWYAWRAGMIPVDRAAGKTALDALMVRAAQAVAAGRQIVIFPEGTRRSPGAEPRYKVGVAHLYSACHVACVPVALNSGLFWPRRKGMRFPGTIRVEVLDPIPPDHERNAFFAELERGIETATAQLVAQGIRERSLLSPVL